MNKEIWKYTLKVGNQTVVLPQDAKILCAKAQKGQITIWAVVKPRAILETREIEVRGTGWPFDAVGDYIDSVIVGDFVWHVFDMGAG